MVVLTTVDMAGAGTREEQWHMAASACVMKVAEVGDIGKRMTTCMALGPTKYEKLREIMTLSHNNPEQVSTAIFATDTAPCTRLPAQKARRERRHRSGRR